MKHEKRRKLENTSEVFQTTDFCITGMDCADCAAKLENAYRRFLESKDAGKFLTPPK